MLSYYGYTISPNQIETGEGFLICRNVPIARTGTQEYMGREIGLTGQNADKIITVRREPEEVFSSAALASFEGKPATNDHPPDLIGPDDVGLYEKGHAQNIRRGVGDWADYIVADLHIHDRELIEAIQNGKREISCGYECDYVDNGDGTYSQKNIRGNHVAVVERGRAGKRAAILDSIQTSAFTPERKERSMKHTFLQLFGLAAKDKTAEEIAKLAMDTADALDEEGSKPAEGTSGEEKQDPPSEGMDESLIDNIAEKVLARMEEKKAAEKQEEGKDPFDEALEKLTEGETEPGGETGTEARVVPAEGVDGGACSLDKALAAGILKTMRPAVSAIQDEKQRMAVSDALLRCVTAQNQESDLSKILGAAQKNAQKAADSHPAMDLDQIQAAYDLLNPHNPNYGKESR